jgi:putative acetyltransferase
MVHQRAFAPSTAEATLVDELRAAGDLVAELCLVAVRDGAVGGHVAYSRARVAGHSVLALAPLAVLPEHQRTGVGALLMRASLERARRTPFTAVVVLGHPAYYVRFGFTPAFDRL